MREKPLWAVRNADGIVGPARAGGDPCGLPHDRPRPALEYTDADLHELAGKAANGPDPCRRAA